MNENPAEKLRELFNENEEIILAFLFGSAVSGRLTKDSDIDIAVLFNRLPDIADILDMKEAASAAAGRAVDMVVLNDSSPVIRMQVLKNGTVIRKKDEASYSNFFVKTVKEYDDLKYIRKEAEENILKGGIYA